MTAEKMAPWQKGIPLEKLRAVKAVFDAHDKGQVLSVFSKMKEANIATAWIDGKLRLMGKHDAPQAVAIATVLKRGASIRDFTGQVRTELMPGDIVVNRFACLPGLDDLAAKWLGMLADPSETAVMVWTWGERRGLLDSLFWCGGFRQVCHRISTGSEITAGMIAGAARAAYLVPAYEAATLVKLPGTFDPDPLLEQVAEAAPEFTRHYSTYNAGGWEAVALRGYAPLGCVPSPADIVKPAEMPKPWKRSNPTSDEWVCADTPLRAALPAVEPLLAGLGMGCAFHRIRLMRLAPGGGELKRHADIVDPDAGVEDGKAARIHIPLLTNLDVKFRQWKLSGEQIEVHMAAGEAWYLDTRKPHTAKNAGQTDRIHLVVDVEGSQALRAEILQGVKPWNL